MDLGLEGPDPARHRLAAGARHLPRGPRRGLERHRGRRRRRRRSACSFFGAAAVRHRHARRPSAWKGSSTDGLPRRLPRHAAPDGAQAAGHHASTRRRRRPSRSALHGRHVLNRYEDGMEKCIGCELCAGVCPARCIYVRGADNPADDPVSPGERYGFVYEINYLRCIHCDLCVEACPTEAITETKLFEFSFTNRADAIYTKAELLVDDDGMPQQLPWEDWRPGEDRPHLGWMRATAPSGDAALRGRRRLVRRARLRRAGPRGRPGRQGRRSTAAESSTSTATTPSPTAGRPRRPQPRRRPRAGTDHDRRSRRLRRLRGDRARRWPRCRALAQPGPLGAEPGGHPVRHRRAVPEPGRPALAAVQVIVYAGAIVVLFLFVIMLLGVDRPRTTSRPSPSSASGSSPCWSASAARRRRARRADHRRRQRRHRRQLGHPGARVRHRERRASSAVSCSPTYVFALEITAGAAHRSRWSVRSCSPAARRTSSPSRSPSP